MVWVVVGLVMLAMTVVLVSGIGAALPRAHSVSRKAQFNRSQRDVWRVITDFGQAARRCQAGGLDGCEVSVFSHLTNQFLTPAINKRDDEYGGSLENRLRFTLEVLEAVRAEAGDHLRVGARHQWDLDVLPRLRLG